ncbi:FMRFamide receptor-like [Patella vulgata]|uniref:FMRFamide receptor-like n=1 Tax=Patella vulgata TaxID=6465 RepID=UPI002180596E|nr:FMRFamide receptor-like [Patella vulgata]
MDTDIYISNLSTTPLSSVELNAVTNHANNVSSNNVMPLIGSCVGSGDDPHEDFYRTAQYATGMVIYPILCIIGLTGNVLALMVLSHRNMATSTNVYLSGLAVSDTIKLLNDLLYFIMLVISIDNEKAGTKMLVSVYPFAHFIFNMSVCVTAWLTVSVAVERYISVCYPTQAKQLCTIQRARIVCVFVFIFMNILTLPSAFTYKPVYVYDEEHNVSCHDIGLTELGANKAFMVPYQWVQSSSRAIIPLIVLVFLNVRIINELRKERVKGKTLSSRNKITLMLIVIIVIFVVCITPDAIMSTFFGFGYVTETSLVKGIREITDSLLAFNSAINFLLYCIMNKLFRITFLVVLCGREPARIANGSKRSFRYEQSTRRRSSNKLKTLYKRTSTTSL